MKEELGVEGCLGMHDVLSCPQRLALLPHPFSGKRGYQPHIDL